MQTVTDFDENYRNAIDKGLVFQDIWDMNIGRYGMGASCKGGRFMRMPDEIAKATNEGVWVLNYNTSGMRIRLKTTSQRIGIRFTRNCRQDVSSNFCIIGICGFDMMTFENGKWRFRDVLYKVGNEPLCLGVYDFGNREEKEILIHFPIYANVDKLEIGLEEDATCTPGEPYRNIKPVLYYGSSITQGGCASRPGNTYQAKIARRLNLDFMNMGFSGSAMGEQIMAEYLGTVETSLFVCDYDHNSPSAEHLKEHHHAFYKTYRDKQPDVPILFVTKPDVDSYPADCEERRKIIYDTFAKARASGDTNVYFLDGSTLFGTENREDCTVDGCHPNDLGFERMAQVIGQKIKEILEI